MSDTNPLLIKNLVPGTLDQGPFGIEQDDGWCTLMLTTPSNKPLKNFGMGLVAYAWEENGPSVPARKGLETLEQHIEKLSNLPFIDVLYIRCDWRDVQKRPGRLDLSPIWKLTLDAAKQKNLRVAFRVQLSSPNFQPAQLAMPDFLQEKIPFVNIGSLSHSQNNSDFLEPRYDHPEFQKAFRELNELLAAEFDKDPLMEFVDLMMYGFWGEGHTGNRPHPFPDNLTAEKTFMEMTRLQLEAWKNTYLAVNTQPDISSVGNRAVQALSIQNGCWLRTDSIVVEEPIQVDMISNRPPWLAAIIEDGAYRKYDINDPRLQVEAPELNMLEKSILHALDIGGNYWCMWTEAENIKRYYEKYPDGINTLRSRIGYRVRPSWIWQRKRFGTDELVIAFANDGSAGVPGILWVYVESLDGKVKAGGSLDAGQPDSGKLRQASFVLPEGMDTQKVKIRAEIETKGGARRPVEWACAQPLNPDGSLTVQLKGHDEAGWRKGL